jgi:arylsulfatase A-like enzyme
MYKNMKKQLNINRREFVKRIFSGIIGGAAVVNFPRLSGQKNTAQSAKKEKKLKPGKPNIILIVVDDQIISSLEVMPTIRSQLVDRGITFTNSFCTSPVCAPSRASILTGQYLHNHGETTNSTRRFVSKRDKENSISTVLKDGGYRTVFIGKYINGYNNKSYIPPGWDEWYAILGKPGYYNYKISNNGKFVSYGNEPKDYLTDVLAQKAYDFIDRHKSSSQPFFIYLAPFAPHAPRTPAPRHKDKFSNLRFPHPLYEKDISDKPQWIHDDRRLNSKNQEWVIQEKVSKEKLKGLESLLAVDEMLDRIIKMLINTGKLENTFIFYLADNGDDLSRHINASGKLLPYEEGIRTPIIVRGPGIEAINNRDHLVSTVDLLPTIAELARIPIPDFVDGRSLVPLLSCKPLPLSMWRKVCLVELGKFESWFRKSPPPAYKLLRTRNFKYIEYDTGEKEFYDLRLDPYELLNTFKNLTPKQKNILHLRLQQLGNCSKNMCRVAEDNDISIYF